MTQLDFLIIVAGVQGGFLVAIVGLIVVTRLFWMRRRRQLAGPRQELEDAMRAWLARNASIEPVLAHLRRLPPTTALDMLVHYASHATLERWRELAQAVSRERWARRLSGRAHSRFWWHRLEAARQLAIAAGPFETGKLLRLLEDEHPAVVVAAIGALDRFPNPALATALLRRIPTLFPTVRAYAAATLQRGHAGVVPALAKVLGERGQRGLPAYVDLAGRIADPRLREPVTALADHPDFEVRTSVARALASFPHDDSVAALGELATDKAWQARAQAVRSLGKLGVREPAPFEEALRDSAWWVRLRGALALMGVGPEGRNALLSAEVGADAFARDMARFVLGLSPAALAEYQR